MSITVFHDTAAQGDVKVFPMSLAQEGLWFLAQLEPARAASIIPLVLRLRGLLDVQALERSLHLIVQRHEALRTTFGMRQGQPVQVIAPPLALPLSLRDLRGLPEGEPEAEVLRLARAPFDLQQGPLLRATVLQGGAQEQLLLLSLHPLVCDGWSLGVFLRELATLYEACSNGQPSPLPELPMQYADFARWQRERLAGGLLAESLAYWRQQLAGSPAGVDLPTDRPRLPVPTVRGATYGLRLPRALTAALKELSRQQGVTLYMSLVAAFQTLLYRYSGQEDVVLGSTTAGRLRAETQAVIGLVENTLVLRTDLSGNPSFAELLGRVRAVILGAQGHEELPFEALVKALHPTRALGQNPLFQVRLRLAAAPPALPAGWMLAQMEVETGTSPFDLTLDLEDGPDGLSSRFEYSTDLFEEASIARMAGHWQTLLEGVVADPTRRLADLPLLTEQERCQLLVEWNATQVAYPQEQCLHQLFEAQVERSPEAVAVVCEEHHLTYHELNARANQLARHLRELGVMPETLVALLMERSMNFVAAILAVFKAGGAFLPLDLQHPVGRHYQILQQSGCQLVLTTDKYGSTLAEALVEIDGSQRPQVIDIETLLQKRAAGENLPLRSVPGNLAYIMYTSGSTGAPKGVMVEQLGMVNHIYAKIADLALNREDRVAQNGPPCFDIVVWQCLAALLVGGCVYVFKDEIAHDTMRLLEQIEEKKITILQAVPSILRAVVQQAEMLNEERPRLANLRWAVPTGDALSAELCRQWLKLYPAIPLLNTYGSTECSDDQCHYAIDQPPSLDYPLPIMPIGRPIQNMQTYILDHHLMPVPIGVIGDLYIGGRGVGRGYLHDAQRTAEVFLPDAFAQQPGSRLYKTRDRARYLPDGNIEFLGRSDNLIKVHGVRIEPGEIEALLERHPVVREAVVMARETKGGNKYMAAYVVPGQDQVPTSEELRSWLREKLPESMVPSTFMLLDTLPLNANGKIDRRALPTPELSRSTAEDSYVAPVLLLHHQLVQIWEELLYVLPIGIIDDYFEVGGDSLLAVRLFDRMAQVCGKKLPLSTLFAGATIEQLARALQGETKTKTDSRAPLVAVQAGGSRRPFFYLHGEWRGGALYSLELERYLGPDQPFYLLEPYKFESLAVPPTFEAIAAAHIESLRSVQTEGPYLLGGYCNGGLLAYEMARQLHAQGQTVDLLVLMDPDSPARHRLVRSVISHFCNVMRIGQDRQFDWFLCLQHIYRYLRFSHYRRLKNSELLGTVEQGEPWRKRSKVDFAPLSLRLKALVPKVETLRQDYPNIYDWLVSDYTPSLYSGKIKFFWTSEEH